MPFEACASSLPRRRRTRTRSKSKEVLSKTLQKWRHCPHIGAEKRRSRSVEIATQLWQRHRRQLGAVAELGRYRARSGQLRSEVTREAKSGRDVTFTPIERCRPTSAQSCPHSTPKRQTRSRTPWCSPSPMPPCNTTRCIIVICARMMFAVAAFGMRFPQQRRRRVTPAQCAQPGPHRPAASRNTSGGFVGAATLAGLSLAAPRGQPGRIRHSMGRQHCCGTTYGPNSQCPSSRAEPLR